MLPFNLHNALLAAKCEMDLFDIQQRLPGPAPKTEAAPASALPLFQSPGACHLTTATPASAAAMTKSKSNTIKHRLRQQGHTVKSWAQAHNFNYRDVSDVLRGVRRGHYGVGRDIYFALGINPDERMAA